MKSHARSPQILKGCDVLPPMDGNDSGAVPPSKNQPKPNRKSRRRKTADRFAVVNAFVDIMLRDLNRTEIAVWLVQYRDAPNETASTSQLDIARRAGISDRTVRRAISELCRRGLLEVVRRGGIGLGASTYRIRPLPPISTGQQCPA